MSAPLLQVSGVSRRFGGLRAVDEVSFDLVAGDVYVFCSDGVYDANNAAGGEFGNERLLKVVRDMRQQPSREIVDAIFTSVQEFRGDTAPNDDMTAVAVRITNDLKAESSGSIRVAPRGVVS